MAIEFKSRTFSLNLLEQEEVKDLMNDLGVLSKIEHEKLGGVVGAVKEIVLAKTKKDQFEIHNKMVDSQIVPNRQSAIAAHRFVRFFFKIFAEESTKEDNSKDIAADLHTVGLDSNLVSFTDELLEAIKQEAKWYEYNQLKESFHTGLFPILKGVGTTVELRGVFNREIKYREKVEEYSKEVKLEERCPIVPIISIAITLDSGTPDRFIFQASPEEAEWLIEELKAALHKVKMIREHYGNS